MRESFLTSLWIVITTRYSTESCETIYWIKSKTITTKHSIKGTVCRCVFSCEWLLVTLKTAARQALLSMGFPRLEYWSGLPFPPLEDLHNQGIEPMSPAWHADCLPLSHLGNPGGIPIYLNPVCLSSGLMCNLPCRRVIHACSLSSDKAVFASVSQMWAEVTYVIPPDVRYMVYHISVICQVEAVLSVCVLE